MAETTRAPLITDADHDFAELAYERCHGNPADMLEEVAPRLRARWVAEALEKLGADLKGHEDWLRERTFNVERIVGVSEAVATVRTLAAEYRDGKR